MKTARKVQYITDQSGKKQSVVLPVDTYEELLEDMRDLVAIAERKKERSIPFEQVVKKLKADGRL